MDKKELLAALEERMKKIKAQIENCKERLEHSAYSIDTKTKEQLKELEKQQEKILEDIEKIKQGADTILDKVRIGIENLAEDINNKVRRLSLELTIKSEDKKTANTYLEKHHKSIDDYQINIDIDRLENIATEVRATRLIIIKNQKTGKVKKYPAGTFEADTWHIEFEKDLKNNFFES